MMIRRALLLGRWGIDFLFAVDRYNIDDVIASLYDLGASDFIIERAENLILSSELNTGFTYINDDLKRGLIVVGPTSSGKEFVNTFVHEIYHLAVAIASNLGIDLESEAPAYLAGDTAMRLTDTVCSLGCSSCREVHNDSLKK